MRKIALTILLFVWAVMGALADGIAITHGPYLQNVGETEATFVWVANKPSIGWVELAPDDGTNYYAVERPKFFDTTNGVKNTSTLHSVKVKGLKPGTNYRYRVYVTEVLSHKSWIVNYGRTDAIDVFYGQPPMFRTNDTKKAETSFAVVNDIHARAGDITKLMNVANYKQKDMVIFNGDMLSNLTSEEQIFTGFMDESIKLFAKEKPLYYVRGNHETRGEYATMCQKYFSPKEPHLYYMFSQGPVCFIMLDTGEDKPDTDLEYSGITDYDNYRNEQAEWLAQVVKSEEYRRAKWHVVVGHIPPRPVKDMWHGQYEVLRKFVRFLSKETISFQREHEIITISLYGTFHFLARHSHKLLPGTLFNNVGSYTIRIGCLLLLVMTYFYCHIDFGIIFWHQYQIIIYEKHTTKRI